MFAAAQLLNLPSPSSKSLLRPVNWTSTTTAYPGFRGFWARKRRLPSSVSRCASAAAMRVNGCGEWPDAGQTAVAAASYGTTGEIKAALLQSLEGVDRGIFGIQSQKRSEIENLVRLLESRNPTSDPTDHLDQVDGRWKLLYSTITILGSKRTKLGLRDFVSLGEFFQIIDVAQGKAINVIEFNVRGFKMLSGQLTIVASFTIASKSRVDIKFHSSDISPEQLMNLFQKNHDLLLAIFNPEGWLEITYPSTYQFFAANFPILVSSLRIRTIASFKWNSCTIHVGTRSTHSYAGFFDWALHGSETDPTPLHSIPIQDY